MLQLKSKNATSSVFLLSYLMVVTLSKTKTRTPCWFAFFVLKQDFCLVLENSTVLHIFTNHIVTHDCPCFVNYRPTGAG